MYSGLNTVLLITDPISQNYLPYGYCPKKRDIFVKTWYQIKRFYLHDLNNLSLAERTIWQLKEFSLSANSFNIVQIACLSEQKSCNFCISSLAEDVYWVSCTRWRDITNSSKQVRVFTYLHRIDYQLQTAPIELSDRMIP